MTNRQYKVFVRVPFLLVFAILLIMGTASRRGLMDFLRMKRQNREIDAQVALLQIEKSELEQKIKAVKLDKDAQERVIRSHLGLVKKSELVVEFP